MNRNGKVLVHLRSKLELTKNFVKAVDRNGRILYLKKKLPKLSEEKIEDAIFVGPQIKEIVKNEIIVDMLNETTLRLWSAFISIFMEI